MSAYSTALRLKTHSHVWASMWYTVPVPAYVEYTEYADVSNETGATMEGSKYNAGNALLEALTMPGLHPSDTTEPAGVGGVQGGCVVLHRGGHSGHVYVHGMVSRRAPRRPNYAVQACIYIYQGVESRE